MTETAHAIALFETELGRMGVAWSERGLRAVSFPHARDATTRARLRRSAPGARELEPPAEIADAIEGIASLLAGERVDLAAVELDLEGVGPFDRRVTEATRGIPVGETLTYGEIASRIGAPREAREVGQALGRNRLPIVVPCHRVVAADGGLGGFSAPGGTRTKMRLLAIERRHAPGPLVLFEA